LGFHETPAITKEGGKNREGLPISKTAQKVKPAEWRRVLHKIEKTASLRIRGIERLPSKRKK